VTRPMNPFMLYRSAFIKRAREWCRQNKEQILSQVIAISWKMEPPEVRERYERYAKVERSNHVKAHPTYKFSP
ncbi:high mobility group box domain-containing protein, partial [Paraphoma chrysanthemicola]